MANCSIIRNPNTNYIEKVLAPNGKNSRLYENALNHLREVKNDVIQNQAQSLNDFKFQEEGVTITLKREDNGRVYLKSVEALPNYPITNVFNRVLDKFDKEGFEVYVDKNSGISEQLLAHAGFMDSVNEPDTLHREVEKFKAIPSEHLKEQALTLWRIAYTDTFAETMGKWNFTEEELKEAESFIKRRKREIKQVQTYNALKGRILAEKYKNLQRERVRFQIVGERGLQNSNDTYRKQQLETAKTLKEAGADNRLLWETTGWYNTQDGWKSELSDGKIIDTTFPFESTEEGFENKVAKTKLENFYHNPSLYEFYPSLRDIEVVFYKEPETSSLNQDNGFVEGNKIFINDKNYGFNEARENREAEKIHKGIQSLTHEIQHLIQGIEGFERGGGENTFRRFVETQVGVVRNLLNDGFNQSRTRAESIMEHSGISRMLSIRFGENSTTSHGRMLASMSEQDIEQLIEDVSYYNYLRMAGEVEARNVANRLSYTEEYKQSKSPLDTEEFYEKDKIYSNAEQLFPNVSKSVKDYLGEFFSEELQERKAFQDKVLRKIQNVFAKKFHNFNIVRNIEDFTNRIGEENLLRTNGGKIMGAVLDDGTIFIDKDNFSLETPIHEASHLWEKLNPQLWSEGVDKFKDALFKSEELQNIVESVRRNQPHLEENQVYSEALNDFIGKWGSKSINEKEGKLDGLLKWLKDFFNSIFSLFNPSVKAEKNLNNFAKMAVSEIVGEIVEPLLSSESLIPERFKLSTEEIFGVDTIDMKQVPVLSVSKYLEDEYATDSNGEPHLKDVLVMDNIMRNWKAAVTPAEIYKLSNNFGNVVGSMEELYQEINRTFFPSGYFQINPDLLMESKLYSKGEAITLLNHPEVQRNVQRLFEAVRKEYMSNNIYLENTLDNSKFSEELVQYKDEVDDLGKVQKEDPIEVENYFKENLAGVKDRQLFNNIVSNLKEYPQFVNRFENDLGFAEMVFNKYSNMTKIFRLQDIKDEVRVRRKGATFSKMFETLKHSEKGLEIGQDAAFLKRLDKFVWDSNAKEVVGMLRDIEEKFVDYNIDVIGLSEQYYKKSKEDILNFVENLYNFTEKLKSNDYVTEDIEKLSEDIDTFFGRDNVGVDAKYEKVSENNRNKTLVELSSEKSDLELFEQQRLIKTSDGYYQKVNVKDTLEEAYDDAVSVIINNPNVINNYFLKSLPFFKNGMFNRLEVQKPENVEMVKEAFREFIRKESNKLNDPSLKNRTETAQKWTIYKLMNKNPLNTEKMPNFASEALKYQKYRGNYHYLTNNFHADFQNYILKNKFNNTSLYNNVLKYFEVNENGIHLNTNNPLIKERIKNSYIQDEMFEHLKQYALLSKHPSMQDLFEYEEDIDNNNSMIELERYYYSNNFSQMKSFKGDYRVNGDILVANNVSDNFIRVKEGLFEKMGDMNGNSVYARQTIMENPNLNNYEYSLQRPSVDMELARGMVIKTSPKSTNVIKLYSKEEAKIINQQYNECS